MDRPLTPNIEALEKLAELLERPSLPLPFNLAQWHCGTAACAVGQAAVDPWFNARGLTLEEFTWGGYGPSFEDRSSWPAVQAFFGLTRVEASYLFDVDSYAIFDDPKLVAARIREEFL